MEMPEPKFYDVYIVDKAASTSASLTMYPVPIRVLNYGGNTGNVREWFGFGRCLVVLGVFNVVLTMLFIFS